MPISKSLLKNKKKIDSLRPRNFGIELELSRQFTRINNQNKRHNTFWKHLSRSIRSLQELNKITLGWKVKTDLSCGGEIVSPILVGQDGVEQIAQICQMAREINKESESPLLDGECSIHLHFDAQEFTHAPRSFSRLLKIVHLAEVIFYEMYPNRRMDYCAPMTLNMVRATRVRDMWDLRDLWYRGSNNIRKPEQKYSSSFINSNKTAERYDGTRYHGFNLHCFWSIGTVEFRYCEGTFDPLHIKAWYELCLAIVNTAFMRPKLKVFSKYKTDTLEFPELRKHFRGDYRFRKLILDLAGECRLSKDSLRLIISKIKENRPSLLTKRNKNNTEARVITFAERRDFFYVSVDTGNYYDHNGLRIIKSRAAKPGIKVKIKRTSNRMSEITSASSRFAFAFPFIVKREMS